MSARPFTRRTAADATVGRGARSAPWPFREVQMTEVHHVAVATAVAANADDPFSSGRRDGAPDEDGTISIRLPRPLPGGSR